MKNFLNLITNFLKLFWSKIFRNIQEFYNYECKIYYALVDENNTVLAIHTTKQLLKTYAEEEHIQNYNFEYINLNDSMFLSDYLIYQKNNQILFKFV